MELRTADHEVAGHHTCRLVFSLDTNIIITLLFTAYLIFAIISDQCHIVYVNSLVLLLQSRGKYLMRIQGVGICQSLQV